MKVHELLNEGPFDQVKQKFAKVKSWVKDKTSTKKVQPEAPKEKPSEKSSEKTEFVTPSERERTNFKSRVAELSKQMTWVKWSSSNAAHAAWAKSREEWIRKVQKALSDSDSGQINKQKYIKWLEGEASKKTKFPEGMSLQPGDFKTQSPKAAPAKSSNLVNAIETFLDSTARTRNSKSDVDWSPRSAQTRLKTYFDALRKDGDSNDPLIKKVLASEKEVISKAGTMTSKSVPWESLSDRDVAR